MKFQLTQISLLVTGLFLAAGAHAQSTTDVGTINVQGAPGGTDTGLIQQEDSSKARSSITKDYIDKVGSTATPYQLINLKPGVNAFGQDATGLFGGNIRVRGFNSDQIGLTINGAPVNDSGNFALFPQEYSDPDNLCSIFVTQGSTDTDAPHVGASGGNIGLQTCAPKDLLGATAITTFGSDSYRRNFVRLDTGKLFGLASFFVSQSHAEADKYKGAGGAKRDHTDFGAHLDLGKGSFVDGSFLYNRAVNNNYRTLTKADIAAEGYYADFGTIAPVHQTPVAGTAQNDATFGPNVANNIFAAPAGTVNRTADSYYGTSLNPFRNYLATLNAHWQIAPNISAEVSPYMWYGFGTGGNELFTVREGVGGNIVHGGLPDVNKDGDTLDTVAVYNGSLTRTYRPGVISKFNIDLYSNHIQLGYWFEKTHHYQTGPNLPIDSAGNISDIWENSPGNFIRQADGQPIEFRDWLTINTVKSPFVQDTISLLNDKLVINAGLKHESYDRVFHNSANTTTGATGDYTIERDYAKTLPSIGVTYHFTPEHSVFASIAKNAKAPNNTSLSALQLGGTIVNGVLQGARLRDPEVVQETSWNSDLGYRYAGEKATFSGSIYYINYKNRIATSFDPNLNLSTDFNVGGSISKGAEVEAGYKISNELSFYSSASYITSTIEKEFPFSAAINLPTVGKQYPGTPHWLGAVNLTYTLGGFYAFTQAKYTGRTYTTLVNDDDVSGYTLVDLGTGYKFPAMGFVKDLTLRGNIFNLLNKKYLSINSSSGNSFRLNAFAVTTPGGVKAPDTAVQFYTGSPITFSVSLGASF